MIRSPKVLESLCLIIGLLGSQIQCGGGGFPAPSLLPTSAPTITTQPSSLQVNSNGTASFTVDATGNPTPTFTWSRSNDGGNTWATISGAATSTYSFTTARTDNQAQFQATATNSIGGAASNPATLTVQWLAFTSQPAGQAVTSPQSATFAVTVDANPDSSYQWQFSPDGTTWTPVAGATESSYTTAATTVGNSGTEYRCIASNAAGSLTSDPAHLSVNAPLVAPTITTQPASLQVHSNSTASFTVAASGNPSPTFTWSRSNDGGNTWATISGATSSTYTFMAGLADNGSEFQATAINSVSTVTSAPAALTVIPMIYAGGVGSNNNGTNVPVYWLNGTGTVFTGLATEITSIVVSGNNVFALGYPTGAWGYWLNGTWILSTLPQGAVGGFVSSIAVSGADVYVGGCTYDSSMIYAPGYWHNGNWVSLTTKGTGGGNVNSIVVSGNNVYAGGNNGPGDGAGDGGYWLNGDWLVDNWNDPTVSVIGPVYSLVVSGADVYAFLSAGYGYWLNGTWVNLSTPLPPGTTRYSVECFAVSGGDVYEGGVTVNSSNVQAPGYWLNGAWIGLAPPDGSAGGLVTSLVVSGPEVYVTGCSISSSGVAVPGYWLNGNWVGLTLPSDLASGTVNTIVVQ